MAEGKMTAEEAMQALLGQIREEKFNFNATLSIFNWWQNKAAELYCLTSNLREENERLQHDLGKCWNCGKEFGI